MMIAGERIDQKLERVGVGLLDQGVQVVLKLHDLVDLEFLVRKPGQVIADDSLGFLDVDGALKRVVQPIETTAHHAPAHHARAIGARLLWPSTRITE